MALVTRALAPGVTVFFALSGVAFTLPAPGTIGNAAKPGATDPTWTNIGIVEDGQIEHPYEEKIIRMPMPGAKRAFQVIQQNHDITGQLNVEQVTPLAFQLLFGTATLSGSSTQFNPLSVVKPVLGWLKVQIADSEDVTLTTIDLWVRLKLGAAVSMPAAAETMKMPFEFLVLHSLLNTGSI